MKKLIIGLIVMSSANLFSQVFPPIKGTTLDEKHVEIPARNEKNSIIGIAFSRDAEDALKQWLNPLYETFIKKEAASGGFDLADFHDVNFVFIPMIAGFRRVADEFKKGTDKEFWPYIMDTEKTDVKVLQQSLGVKDSHIPYFYAISPDGKILAQTSGTYSDSKIEKLENAIE